MNLNNQTSNITSKSSIIVKYVFKNNGSKTICNEETIEISSGSSKAISISSSDESKSSIAQSCPMCKSPEKDHGSLDQYNATSTESKVRKWLDTCNKKKIVKKPDINITCNTNDGIKKAVMIRVDFEKEANIGTSVFKNKVASFFPDKISSTSEKMKSTNLHQIGHMHTNNLFVPTSKEHISDTNQEWVDKTDKPNRKFSTSSEIPLSPESQKKRELCSYLQLVNLSSVGAPEGVLVQNRRSVRVKNLILLSEKKELEKKLNDEDPMRMEKLVQPVDGSDKICELLENSCQSSVSSSKSINKKALAEPLINIVESKIDADINTESCANIFIKTFQIKVSKKQDFDDIMLSFLKNEKLLNFDAQQVDASKSTNIKRKNSTTHKTSKKTKISQAKPECRSFSSDEIKEIILGKNNGNVQEKPEIKHKFRVEKRLVKRIKRRKTVNSRYRDIVRNKFFYNQPILRSQVVKLKKKKLSKKIQDENRSVIKQEKFNISTNEITLNEHSYSLNSLGLKNSSCGCKVNNSTPEDKKSKDTKHLNQTSSRSSEEAENLNKSLNNLKVAKHHKLQTPVIQQRIQTLNSPELETNGQHEASKISLEYLRQETNTPEVCINNQIKKKSPSFQSIEIEQSYHKIHRKPSILKEKLIFNNIDKSPPFLGFSSPRSHLSRSSRNSNFSSEDWESSSAIAEKCIESPESVLISDSKSVTTEDHNLSSTEEISHSDSSEVFKQLKSNKADYIPLDMTVEMNSLHKSLTQFKRQAVKSLESNSLNWEDSLSVNKSIEKRSSHSIYICEANGPVLNAAFLDYNLVIVQKKLVTFYDQSPLGKVLAAQNMWLPKGCVQRLALDTRCTQKKSSEKLINLENSIAYIELWTKEHESDKRERPVADIFAAIYFWRNRPNTPDKKVLQIENIKGYAKDVQYVVIRSSRNIVVSWNEKKDETQVTTVRCYNLDSDYQTVASIKEIQSLNYCINSLYNVEEGESLLMGFGENKATIWNLEYGYVIATININDIQPQPDTVWVKCERGYLFTLQNIEEGNLRLIAIKGTNNSWKQLTLYKAPKKFKNLKGVCVENGILVAFYDNGVLCWNFQTGELLIEELSPDLVYFPSNNHVVIISLEQVLVKNAIAYLITM